MKRKTLSLISITSVMLVLVLIIGILFSGQSISANAAEFTDKTTAIEFEKEVKSELTEEKTYCTATLDDDFADDTVLVVLNKEASIGSKAQISSKTDSLLREYTRNDFSEIASEKIEDLTRLSSEKLSKQIVEEEKQRLLIEKVQFGAKSDIFTDEIIVSEKTNAFEEINVETYRKIISIKLKEKGKENVLKAIKQLEKRADVLSAEPDYIQTFFTTIPSEYNNLTANQRWAMDKIGLPNAWQNLSGSSTVTVGVIDTGIDSTHPDLKNQMDKSLCRDFTSGVGVADPNPTDSFIGGHGTLVAGIIGAEANNGGAVGVCLNVKLVSLKVRDEKFNSTVVSDITKAVEYATDRGIPILNYSGGSAQAANNNGTRTQAIINYPGLFVCAAGNDGSNNDIYPVYPANHRLDNLISVGASTNDDQIRSDSNFGASTVDIFAPGSGIYTTTPDGKYNSNGGQTSLATPFVTGAAALILSRYPTMRPEILKANIMESVDKYDSNGNLLPFHNKCTSGGRLKVSNELKILNTAISSKTGGIWRIEVTNPGNSQIELVYNAKMCNSGDARAWTGLTDIKTTNIAAKSAQIIDIQENGTAGYIAVSYIKDGKRIITCADKLNVNKYIKPYVSKVDYNYYNNIGIVGKNFDTWIIKVTNNYGARREVQYNAKMCFAGDAANWTLDNRSIISFYLESGESRNVNIAENVFATHIAVSFCTDYDRYIRYANNLNANGTMTVSDSQTFRYLKITNAGFNGGWKINIFNHLDSTITVSYNEKMCNQGDAANWTGLGNEKKISILGRQTKEVIIKENWFATCITVSYRHSNGRRLITYANLLSTDGGIFSMYNSTNNWY